ncbi:PilZ domain-containing protein [Paenibacillus allorhizosphaerae]|uniref:PilZ domain-containing protein n=1 Tax=Paenibacillus allorhizosphaerae TaxID=2849866 RepID=A0ABN7TG51_9BACL|nr:PilZ domain-containing protein [Paenibacillus allorhizosphaerae]CAG7621938.1 hypothetical protein PAECIP111802_00773 [Paenibacillus allorhizosphaerae]
MVTENKRKFFRVHFERPLLAEIKLIGLQDRDFEPDIKNFKAAVVDIGAGGARFFTETPLPDAHRLLVEMKFTVLGKQYNPLGTIVRSILPEEGHNEYSSEFSLQESETAALTSMLNSVAIKLRKSKTPAECIFCSDEDLAAFMPLRARKP